MTLSNQVCKKNINKNVSILSEMTSVYTVKKNYSLHIRVYLPRDIYMFITYLSRLSVICNSATLIYLYYILFETPREVKMVKCICYDRFFFYVSSYDWINVYIIEYILSRVYSHRDNCSLKIVRRDR